MVRMMSVLAVVALCGTAVADPVLDQSYTPATTNVNAAIGSVVDWSQTFKVGATGTLTSVDLLIGAQSTVNANLLVDIRTTVAGVPSTPDVGTNILGTMTVASGTLVNVPAFASIDLSGSSISVMSGDVLAIVLRSTSTGGNYLWGGTTADGYADGAARFRISNWTTSSSFGDLAFKTYVDSMDQQIPEPSTLLLLVAGVGAIVYLRRR